MVAASSRSEFVIRPFGFAKLTTWSCTGRVKGCRHNCGGSEFASSTGGSHTPPIPAFAASLAPTNLGFCSGTSSSMCVALLLRSFTRQCKSSNCACTAPVIRTLSFDSASAACSKENCPLPPGCPGLGFLSPLTYFPTLFFPPAIAVTRFLGLPVLVPFCGAVP